MRIPILALGDILLTSIQSDMTDDYSIVLKNETLEGSKYARACGVIVDITALNIIDLYIARILSETVQLVQPVDGKVVISGMAALTLEQGAAKLNERFLESADDLAEARSDDER
jgi:rsbT antagonist protein RsbS